MYTYLCNRFYLQLLFLTLFVVPFDDVKKSLIGDDRTSVGDSSSSEGDDKSLQRVGTVSVGDDWSFIGNGRSMVCDDRIGRFLVGVGRLSCGDGRFLVEVAKWFAVLGNSSAVFGDSFTSVANSVGDDVRSSGDSKSSGVRSLSGDRSTLDSGSWSRRFRSIDCLTFCDEVLEFVAPCNVADDATEWTDKSGGNTDTDNDEGEEKIKEFEQRLPLLLSNFKINEICPGSLRK